MYVRLIVVGNTKEEYVRDSPKEPSNYPKTFVSIPRAKLESLDILSAIVLIFHGQKGNLADGSWLETVPVVLDTVL